MEGVEFLIAMIIGFAIGTAFGSSVAPDPDKLANSPELLSGTTWQGGECVIILNK